MDKLIKAAKEFGDEYEVIIRILWDDGLREAELAEAKWSDLYETEEGHLGLHIPHTKSGRDRSVKIKPKVFALRAKLHDRPLLPGPNAQFHDRWFIWYVCRQVGNKAGIKCTPHKLRKTHTTAAVRAGATADMLMTNMGWEKLETASQYIKLTTGLQRTTTDLIPEFEQSLAERARGGRP